MWNRIGPFAWLLLMLLLFWPSAAPAQDAGADAERKLTQLLGRAPSSAAVDENGWTDLHYAAVLNLPGLAATLLDGGTDPNVATKHDHELLSQRLQEVLLAFGRDTFGSTKRLGPTPLHLAARGGSYDVARLLIERGADVNARDLTGGGQGDWTVLHYAVWFDAIDLARLVLDHGAVVDMKDSAGRTALYYAAEKNAEAAARLLIGRGADVVAVTDDGQTPLHRAAWANATVVARLLIDEGADVHMRDSDGETALHMAARYNSAEIAGLLLARGVDINGRNQSGWAPLHVAAEHNAADVARLLIGEGVDVNMQSTEGSVAPLHIAAGNDAHEIVQLLIDQGANIWSKSERGLTPLDYAISRESRSTAALLVDREYFEGTLLHANVSYGSYEDVKLLLDFGADVNARNSSGDTPLMLAIRSTREAALKFRLLISHGADINAKSFDDGNTPLHFVMAQIRENDYSAFARARLLLDHGADIRATNYEGETPLTLITVDDAEVLLELRFVRGRPRLDEMRAFLEKGVDPNNEEILLHTLNSIPELLELLLQYGGDVKTELGELGNSYPLLHKLLRGWVLFESKIYFEVAVLLVYGADVNAEDYRGDTPLDIARGRNWPNVEALLRNPSDAKRILEEYKAGEGIQMNKQS